MEVIKKFRKQIGILTRTIEIVQYKWGISCNAMDTSSLVKNWVDFSTRNFRYTKKYTTLDELITRALKHYNMLDSQEM